MTPIVIRSCENGWIVYADEDVPKVSSYEFGHATVLTNVQDLRVHLMKLCDRIENPHIPEMLNMSQYQRRYEALIVARAANKI